MIWFISRLNPVVHGMPWSRSVIRTYGYPSKEWMPFAADCRWLTRTGNCLLKRSLFKGPDGRFLPEFGSGGEDRDFFKRMIYRGHVFVWCAEAPISEMVPPDRWKILTMLRRALLRGKMTYQARKSYPSNLLGSFGAVLFYTVGLPFLWISSPIFGFEVFAKILIRDCDHLGKILALFGIEPVKHRYVVSLAED